MSLVDASYGSSDDDEVELADQNGGTEPPQRSGLRSEELGGEASATSNSPTNTDGLSGGSDAAPEPSPRIVLPDVSELLGPSDAAGTSSAGTSSVQQKKRAAINGSGHVGPRPKISRGTNLQPSRIAPDTAGGLLTPPQLRGRSNVATEDLDKMFSRRQRS